MDYRGELMNSEQSLLEQISEKEEDLKKEYNRICEESEEIISKARKQAALILDNAEKEGKREADLMNEQHMQTLYQDIILIRKEGDRLAEEVRTRGKKNLPRAVSKIISLVTG